MTAIDYIMSAKYERGLGMLKSRVSFKSQSTGKSALLYIEGFGWWQARFWWQQRVWQSPKQWSLDISAKTTKGDWRL